MKKSTRGTVLKPSKIIGGDVSNSKKYDAESDRGKSNIFEKHKILKDKELLFMSSVSIVWFIAFYYFILYVFTW